MSSIAFGVIADGLIVEPLAFIRGAAADVGIGIIGLELDRLGEIGDGLVVEPLADIRGAAVVVGRTAKSGWSSIALVKSAMAWS